MKNNIKIILSIILFIILVLVNVFTYNITVKIYYNPDAQGQATLYYSSDGKFSEEKSIYSEIISNVCTFTTNKHNIKNVMIIPSRVIGNTNSIQKITIYKDNIETASYSSNEILSEILDKDKSSFNKLSEGISVTATDENPYPALIFNEKLNLNKTNIIVIFKDILLACVEMFALFVCLGIIGIAKNNIGALKKLKNIKELFQNKKALWIIFNTISIIVMLVFFFGFKNYTVIMNYNDDNLPEDTLSTVYYDFSGKGLIERKSVYSQVRDGKSVSRITGFGTLKAIGIVPIASVGDTAFISSVDFYCGNRLIKSFEGSSLIDYALNKGAITYNEDYFEVASTAEAPRSNIMFNAEFISYINSYFDWANILQCLIVIAVSNILLIIYLLGKKTKSLKIPDKVLPIVTVLITLPAVIFQNTAVMLAISVIGIAGFAYLLGTKGFRPQKGILFVLAAFPISAVVLTQMDMSVFMGGAVFFSDFLWNVILTVIMVISYIYIFEYLFEPKIKETAIRGSAVNHISGIFLFIIIAFFVFEFFKDFSLGNDFGLDYYAAYILGDVMQMNILWSFSFICLVYGFVGIGITRVAFCVIYAVILFGNIIKLKYHNTVLSINDLMQIKDMFAIAPSVVGKGVFTAVIAAMIIIAVLILINIKKILPHLKPEFFISIGIISLAVCGIFTKDLLGHIYSERNVSNKPYVNDVTNEQTNGMSLFYMYKLAHISDLKITKPDDYSEDTVKAMLDSVSETLPVPVVSETKPDVICIMAESFFDIDEINEVKFNEEVLPTVHEISSSHLISPRYGGYTAAVEYEGITGGSLAFYPAGVIPYTSYFNNKSGMIPSAAMEFLKSGYHTIVMHPGTRNFYNREKAYSMMGFEDYYDETDFENTEENKLETNFFRDKVVAERIIDELEKSDEPVFTFAVTIGAHYTSNDKFKETEIKAECDKLNESELNIINQQAQSFRDTDNMIKTIKDYMDNTDRPTLLYVFGDHLPPMPVFDKLEYTKDLTNKYKTVLLSYSNYKDIELPELMTPNYITPQMLIDAEIKHSRYFDYIYSLRDKYPILHKEFINVNDNEDLRKYYMFQYDAVFGEQYVYEPE